MRTLRLTRRDFTSCGNPAHVVWWMDDRTREWTAGGVDDLPLPEQPREYGRYVARAPDDAYMEVSMCWHHGLNCIQVEGYAETRRTLRRWTGTRYAHFHTVRDAIEYARSEIKTLHKWLNSDGTATQLLTPGPQFGVTPPQRTRSQIEAELKRLEAQMDRYKPLTGTGSKATIAARNAARDRIGARMYEVRQELRQA